MGTSKPAVVAKLSDTFWAEAGYFSHPLLFFLLLLFLNSIQIIKKKKNEITQALVRGQNNDRSTVIDRRNSMCDSLKLHWTVTMTANT